MLSYTVYLLRCADGSLYCGSTRDLGRRLAEHNTSPSGAKYTRSRRPVTVIYTEQLPNRSAALKREAAIKRLTRTQKLILISKPASK